MKSNWNTKTLEDCMEALIDYRGRSPKKTSNGIPLITAKIIKKGSILPITEYIAEDNYDSWMKRGIPEPGDIVMTTEAPLGEVAQLDDRKVALAQRVITMRGKTGVLENDYLKYLLQSKSVQQELQNRSSGTTVLGIRQSELRKLPLPIPPLTTQRLVSRILKNLDDKISNNHEQSKTLESIAQTIFNSWFINFDPVKAKMEGTISDGIDAETATIFPNELVESELGLIPKGWSTKVLSQIVDIHSGGTPKTKIDEYWNGNIPWYSVVDVPKDGEVFVANTTKQITSLGLSKSAAKILPIGSTIISARGTVGKLAVVCSEMTMNQSCYALKGHHGDFYTYFTIKQSLDWLKQNTHGAVFDTITKATFDGLNVIIPDLKLVNKYEKLVNPIMKRIENLLHEKIAFEELRDRLLPRLISGKLRITE